MVSAYILAKIEAEKDNEAIQKIKKIEGVYKATATYGTYDVVLEVDFESIDQLDDFAFDKIRKISSVKETNFKKKGSLREKILDISDVFVFRVMSPLWSGFKSRQPHSVMNLPTKTLFTFSKQLDAIN